MGLIKSLFRAGPPADDDFWYRPIGYGATSLTGLRVDADAALKLSAVWACVNLISESIAQLPLVMYRRLADGKEREPEHPLYDLLHDQPNGWQTAVQWRQQMTAHALLRGAGYSRIVAGPRGFADQLVPLHPDYLMLPSGPGQPYIYRAPGKAAEELDRSDVFRVDGLTLDGWTPCSVIEYARESMGIGLAAEQYAGRVYSQDGRPRGTLEHPGKLSRDAAERLAAEWRQAYSGLGNAHRVAVLQEGMKFSPISVSPEDAQMIASREFSVEDIARWFRVPPHMIGSTAKVTSWGTGIEQLSIGFVTYTLLPWAKRWEQSIRRDLLLDKRGRFAEHEFAALLRGDLESRYRAYAIGRQNRWLSANDVRRLENMNPIPGGDVYDNPAITVAEGEPGGWRASLETLTGGRTNGHA